jgi:histidinol dehydrogenase
VQRVTKAGLTAIGPTVATLARAEGLEGHARSIDVRLATTSGKKTTRR